MKLNEQQSYRLFWALACLLLILASGLTRPFFPLDETRYMGVAWEMWLHHHFLVPVMNGQLYTQKPPLLFWMIHAGWFIFGVNSWWPKLLPGLFAFFTLLITASTAQRFWPTQRSIGLFAATLLLGLTYWAYFTPRMRFDVVYTCFSSLSLLGIAMACEREQGKLSGWLLYALGSTLAILTKGPMCLLFTVPVALLAPLWINPLNKTRWYAGFLFALLICIVLLSAWILPVWLSTSSAYSQSVFVQQTLSRVQGAGWNRPWWSYLYRIPLLLLPWTLWPTFWRTLLKKGRPKNDSRKPQKLLSISLLIGFIGLCLVGPKGARYLIPAFPIFALLAAYLLTHKPPEPIPSRYDHLPFVILNALLMLAFFALPLLPATLKHNGWIGFVSPMWGMLFGALSLFWFYFKTPNLLQKTLAISTTSVILVTIFYLSWSYASVPFRDVRPMAQQLQKLQNQHRMIAFVGHYDDDFHYYGRLPKPLVVITPNDIQHWAKQHPHAWIVQIVEKPPFPPYHRQAVFSQRFRARGRAMLFAAKNLSD